MWFLDAVPDLLRAVRLNSLEMVQFLLARGDKASCRDEDGSTALHHAVALGNISMVQTLLHSYTCDVSC